jgi:hypothetical protein
MEPSLVPTDFGDADLRTCQFGSIFFTYDDCGTKRKGAVDLQTFHRNNHFPSYIRVRILLFHAQAAFRERSSVLEARTGLPTLVFSSE